MRWCRSFAKNSPHLSLRLSAFELLLAFISVFNFIKAEAVEPRWKQSEALYAELLKHPDFKAADTELGVAYAKLKKSLDVNDQKVLRDEQRTWIKLRDEAILSAASRTRIEIAIKFTLERVKQLDDGIALNVVSTTPKTSQIVESGKTHGRAADSHDAPKEHGSLSEEFDRCLENLEAISNLVLEESNQEESLALKKDSISFRIKLWNLMMPGKERPADSRLADLNYELNPLTYAEWSLFDKVALKAGIDLVLQQTELINSKIQKIRRNAERSNSVHQADSKLSETPSLPKSEKRGKIEFIPQTVSWSFAHFDADLKGSKYRIGLIGKRIYLFENRTRLLLRVYDLNDSIGRLGYKQIAPNVAFCGGENFLYCSWFDRYSEWVTILNLPSLDKVHEDGAYRGCIQGPIIDKDGSLGYYISDVGGVYYETLEEVLKTQHLLKENLPDLPKSKLVKSNAEPDRDFKFCRFLDPKDKACVMNREKGIPMTVAIKPRDATEGLKKRKILYTDLKLSRPRSYRSQEGVLALELKETGVLFHVNHSGQLSSQFLDFNLLKVQNNEWSGPRISATSFGATPRIFDSSQGNILFEKSFKEKLAWRASISDKAISFEIPADGGDDDGHQVIPGGSEDRKIYDYSSRASKSGVLLAYWGSRNNRQAVQFMSVFSVSSAEWLRTFCINTTEYPRADFVQPPRHFFDRETNSFWISEIEDLETNPRPVLTQISTDTGEVLKVQHGLTDFEAFAVSDKWIFGLPRMDQPFGELWSREPLQKILQFSWNELGDVIAFDEQGYYAGRGTAHKNIAFRVGEHSYPFEQFDARLNRPDLVYQRLGYPKDVTAAMFDAYQRRLAKLGLNTEAFHPDYRVPEVEFSGFIPVQVDADEIELPISVNDAGDRIERLKVYVNGVPSNGMNGEKWEGNVEQRKSVRARLASGRNKIQVSVLNSAGAESLYASAEVTCTAQRPKPVLWTIALGVSEYADSDWNLKYAAKDARDVADRIRSRSVGTYSEIKELVLTDREVTKESLKRIRRFLSKATVDDTVLLFVAGHGLLDEKYDYYFGTSDVDFTNPSVAGIAFEEFEDILAALPCLKKSFLIDTCHAGELDGDEKTALAVARKDSESLGASPQLAMHRVGARGLFIKPIEGARGKSEWYDRLQGLFVDLRRGSGSMILSSSAGAEYAFESSQQANGLFTYAVLEALDGKGEIDLNNDGLVQMSELAGFVKSRVAELSKNKQTPNIRRVNLESDFAIAPKSK